MGVRGLGWPMIRGDVSIEEGGGVPPVNTVAPVASGTVTIGGTLSCTSGTWTGVPAPTFAYQWQRAGVNIAAATSSSYTPVAADSGPAITCVVTATGFGSASASSNALTYGTSDLVSRIGPSQLLIATSSSGAFFTDLSGNGNNVTNHGTTDVTVDGRACPHAVAASTYMEGPALSSVLTASTFWGLAGVSPDVINLNSATAYLNGNIISDPNLAINVFFRNTGGGGLAMNVHGADFTTQTAISAATANVPVMAEFQLSGGTGSCKAGTGSAQTASFTNLASTAGLQRLGFAGAGTQSMTGAYLFLVLSKTIPSAANIADARAYFKFLFPSVVG